MVNNCPYCTIFAFGIVAVFIFIIFLYGLGAVLLCLSAFVAWFVIQWHKNKNSQRSSSTPHMPHKP